MGVQIAFLVKAFAAVAVWTDKWLFACVDAHMSLKIEIE
jgi:hypothetical protein